MAEEVGPQLPPHLIKSKPQSIELKEEAKDEVVCGPLMLKGAGFSQAVSHIDDNDEKHERSDDDEEKAEGMFGPVLPPGFNKQSAVRKVIGPSLPTGPRDEDGSDDDTLIGPRPSELGTMDDLNQKRQEIEDRALAMKSKMINKNKDEKILKRETWMTELPPELGGNIGIVARTFKKRTLNSTEADRSVWTETPADRERKKRDKQNTPNAQGDEPKALSKRDLEMQEKVAQHNTQYRGQSLLELHQKERKKNKTSGPEERRPFDRDIDLNLRNVDKKSMSSFMQKAHNFNSKFENAKHDSKYL